jgi:hypothetical protein
MCSPALCKSKRASHFDAFDYSDHLNVT